MKNTNKCVWDPGIYLAQTCPGTDARDRGAGFRCCTVQRHNILGREGRQSKPDRDEVVDHHGLADPTLQATGYHVRRLRVPLRRWLFRQYRSCPSPDHAQVNTAN